MNDGKAVPKGLVPFAKGFDARRNPGGRTKEQRAIMERLTTDDATAIYEKAIELAKEGNAPMLIRLLEYLIGKPKEFVEVTGEGGGPVRVVSVDSSKLTKEQLAVLREIQLAARATAEAAEVDGEIVEEAEG